MYLAAALRTSNNNTLTISWPALRGQLRAVDTSKAICKATQHKYTQTQINLIYSWKKKTHSCDHQIFLTLSRSLHHIHHHWGLLSIPVILEIKYAQWKAYEKMYLLTHKCTSASTTLYVYRTENHKSVHWVKKHPFLLILFSKYSAFWKKGKQTCLMWWKRSSILSYHTEPAALHVWSIDRTFQVDNPTLVWAQPGGAHCASAWWQLLWGTQQTNTIHMNISNSNRVIYTRPVVWCEMGDHINQGSQLC